MLFNNYSTRACWVRYFVWLSETLIFWRKYLFQCAYLSANHVSAIWKKWIRTTRFVSHTGYPRTPSEKGFERPFTFIFRFPTNLDETILIVMSRQTVVFCHTTRENKIRTFSFVFSYTHAIGIGGNSDLFFFLFRFFFFFFFFFVITWR